jgi:hypothetical protein
MTMDIALSLFTGSEGREAGALLAPASH